MRQRLPGQPGNARKSRTRFRHDGIVTPRHCATHRIYSTAARHRRLLSPALAPQRISQLHRIRLRHVCASLLIASGASDVQVAHRLGHSKIETTKKHLRSPVAQDRGLILDAMNQAVSRLYA